mgnify:CR=1 FL=1
MFGLLVEKVAPLFEAQAARINKKNADPALVAVWEQGMRRLAASPDEIAKAAESGKDKDFFDFYLFGVGDNLGYSACEYSKTE